MSQRNSLKYARDKKQETMQAHKSLKYKEEWIQRTESEHHFKCTRAFEYLAEPFSPPAIPFPVRFIYPSVTAPLAGKEKKRKEKEGGRVFMAGVFPEKFSRNLPTPHLILARSLTYRALPRPDSSNDLNVHDKFDHFLSESPPSSARTKIYALKINEISSSRDWLLS